MRLTPRQWSFRDNGTHLDRIIELRTNGLKTVQRMSDYQRGTGV